MGGSAGAALTGEPIRAAVGLLVVVAAVCAFGTVAAGVHANPGVGVPLILFAVTGFANVAIGALAWERRPHNRTGALLCSGGFLIILAMAGNSEIPGLRLLGLAVGQGPIAAVLHVLLAFPSGRLGSRPARVLAVSGYLVTIGPDLVRVVEMKISGLAWGTATPLTQALQAGQRSLGAVILVVASLYLIARLRQLRPWRTVSERHALAAVYAWGIAVLWFFPVSANLLRPLFGWSDVTLFLAQVIPLIIMPVVFAVALLRGGFARTGRVEELGAALATARHGHPSLRAAVAAALGDTSVTVRFPVPSGAPGPGRRRRVVEGSAGPFAVIEYDAELIGDERPVAAVAEVVSLALQRDHLLAELVAGREQLLASRTRLVEVADAERRRVVTDLHDVLQSRLVLAAMHVGALSVRTGPGEGGPAAPERTHDLAESVRLQIDAALGELRDLIHGVMPATLIELGLAAAVEELLDRTPLEASLTVEDDVPSPLPDAVASSAYLIVAEAVTNTVKHAAAKRVSVTLARGPGGLLVEVQDDGRGGAGRAGGQGLGMAGLADRAEALGGRIVIDSPPGDGTRITVELPCGS